MGQALVTISTATTGGRLPRIGDTVAYAFVDGDAQAHGQIQKVHDATEAADLLASIPKAPDGGPWPCRTVPNVSLPPRLVQALYVLLRDHVHPGDMEQTLLNVADEEITFSNPHLLALARSHAAFLLK